MIHIPAAHTVFNKESLFHTMASLYDIGTPNSSRFIENGLNDTYSVETEKGRFILRIYKYNWRTEEDIQFELDLLLHLHDAVIPVSHPISRKDDEWLTELDAPEGKRYAVMFTFANGKGKVDVPTSRIYGHSIALLHNSLDSYVPIHDRFELNTSHLLEEPLQHMLPFLQHRPEDWQFVQETASLLQKRIDALPKEALDWGVCHGDLHGWNVFHGDDGSLTHFDFDCGGMGWRSYDLSVFLWDQVHGKTEQGSFKNECWDAFLAAYVIERPLSEADLAMIPIFVATRQLWLMGLHTQNSGIWGAWQNDGYFDGKLAFLRAWIAEYPI